MTRFLVTTALEETWPEDQPVLFLGEGCRRYTRRDRWERMDAAVLPNHWDDRARLLADYRYLTVLHERLLGRLAIELNRIHQVDHGLRYWRILVGPWLGYFVQILFDRWISMQRAVEAGATRTIILAGGEENFVPRNMDDFGWLLLEDGWNHHLCGILAREFTSIECVFRERRPGEQVAVDSRSSSGKLQLQRLVAKIGSRLAGILSRESDGFLRFTYLPALDEIKLHRRLGQVPQLWRPIAPIKAEVDQGARTWSLSRQTDSAFEECAGRLIARQIPTLYLEGYQRLIVQAEALPWPKKPWFIWTANGEIGDDLFKAWSAEKTERGAPLIIGQHGGHYGMGLWSFTEQHQMAISDRYLSWGWMEPGNLRIVPVGQVKAKAPSSVHHARKPRALLVTVVHPRFSYWMYSTPVAGQWLDYFEDQFSFVSQLPKTIQDALTVRLYPLDFGWDQAARWRDRFPALRLDQGSSMAARIGESRLYISTYNATTFLESLTMDVPTVIYWRKAHWELRDAAVPYFDELERAGIFHSSPESAARHVAAVWDDVDGWWESAPVRKARKYFKARYCHRPADLLDRVEAALRETAGARKST